MAAPTERLARMVRQLFPAEHAEAVIAELSALPKTSQSSERIQAAMVVRSGGNYERFLSEVELVRLDWRDTLMGSGLEHSDYQTQLDRLLGAAP